MQVGFAVVLWSWIGAMEGSRHHWYDVRGHWWTLVPLAIVGYAVVALLMPSYTGHGKSTRWRIASGVVWAVLGIAGGVQIGGLALAHQWVADDFLIKGPDGVLAGRTPTGGLPYFAGTVGVLCIAAVLLLFAVIAAVFVACKAGLGGDEAGEHRPLRPALWGSATSAFAALAVFLAAGFTAGGYTFVATYLNTGSAKPRFHEVSNVFTVFPGMPSVVFTAGIAYAVSVMLLLALLVITLLVIVPLFVFWPGNKDRVAKDYPDSVTAVDSDAPGRRKQLGQAMFIGSLVDFAQWLIAAVVLTGLIILGVFAGVLIDHGGDRPTFAHGWLTAPRLAGMGCYFAVLTLAGLVSLGAVAFRVPKSRRVVGILWDVASFWPRACHPLAAPCYAERTVPDLITFVTDHRAKNADAKIVLTAHSQGTVISAATIRQLDTYDNTAGVTDSQKVVPRLSFVSCGCVLRRLYGRFFPAYFGPPELHALQTILTTPDAKLPRWRNLWRYTDYLGGQVTDGPPQRIPAAPTPTRQRGVLATEPPAVGPAAWEWHSPDPPFFDRQLGDTTYSHPDRHSNFWGDESGYLQLAVCDLLKA
jgi:hypothetical protein